MEKQARKFLKSRTLFKIRDELTTNYAGLRDPMAKMERKAFTTLGYTAIGSFSFLAINLFRKKYLLAGLSLVPIPVFYLFYGSTIRRVEEYQLMMKNICQIDINDDLDSLKLVYNYGESHRDLMIGDIEVESKDDAGVNLQIDGERYFIFFTKDSEVTDEVFLDLVLEKKIDEIQEYSLEGISE